MDIIFGDINNPNPLKCPYFEPSACGAVCPGPCAKWTAYKAEKPKESLIATLPEDRLEALYTLQRRLQERIYGKPISTMPLEDREVSIRVMVEAGCDEIQEALAVVNWIPEVEGEKAPYDLYELKKELIDLQHFVFNLMLYSNMTMDELVQNMVGEHTSFGITDNLELTYMSASLKYSKAFSGAMTVESGLESLGMLTTNRLFRNILNGVNWKPWKKTRKTVNFEKMKKDLAEIQTYVFWMMQVLEMTEEEIFDIYIEKNVENHVRQDNGY